MLKYVCISDLHAGAETSLLTTYLAKRVPVFTRKSDVTLTFAEALKDFLQVPAKKGEHPELILLGDVVDLQFSKRSDATASAGGFLQALCDTGVLAPRVVATAGNHDHALWTDARLALEALSIGRGEDEISYLKSTPAFSETPGADSRLLTALVRDAGFDSVDFRYPNIGFAKDNRSVVLHHGHFVEPEYRMMTRVLDTLARKPRPTPTAEQLSEENAGWIDFAWSTFGDAAALGRDAEALYQNLLTSMGYRRLSAKWAEKLGEALSDRLPLAGNLSMQAALNTLAQTGLDLTIGRFRDTERYAEVDALTSSGFHELRWFLEGPVRGQIIGEEKPVEDVTFTFGHTHKPFSDRITATGFGTPVKVYNTGGWTLNGPRLGTAEGAAMVMIDDACNVASLRLFTTPENGEMIPVHIEMLTEDAPGAAEFRAELEGWLDASRDAWAALTEAAHKAYDERQQLLLQFTAGQFDTADRLETAE